MRLIDADALCEGLVSNHPVVIAARCAPTIEAKPVRYGQWVRSPYWLFTCSACGVNDLFGLSSYCSNCGAKMSGGASDAEKDEC